MATTIEQIMDGIEARLTTIVGLNTSAVEPGQITTPTVVVGLPQSIDYNVNFTDNNIDLTFTVYVITSRAIDFSGQKQLATYLDKSGSNSILAAINGDETLGGLVDFCVVDSATPGPVTFNDVRYYGAVLSVRVCSSGA